MTDIRGLGRAKNVSPNDMIPVQRSTNERTRYVTVSDLADAVAGMTIEVDSDDVANRSNVSGGSVTDALNTLLSHSSEIEDWDMSTSTAWIDAKPERYLPFYVDNTANSIETVIGDSILFTSRTGIESDIIGAHTLGTINPSAKEYFSFRATDEASQGSAFYLYSPTGFIAIISSEGVIKYQKNNVLSGDIFTGLTGEFDIIVSVDSSSNKIYVGIEGQDGNDAYEIVSGITLSECETIYLSTMPLEDAPVQRYLGSNYSTIGNLQPPTGFTKKKVLGSALPAGAAIGKQYRVTVAGEFNGVNYNVNDIVLVGTVTPPAISRLFPETSSTAINRNKTAVVTDGLIIPELYESMTYTLTTNTALTVQVPAVSGDFSFTTAVHITRSNTDATYSLNIPSATINNIGQYPIGSASAAPFETLFMIIYRVGSNLFVDLSIGRAA